MSAEKKVNCKFMVMTDTGERPDAAIHIVGFERDGGIQVVGRHEGGARTVAQLLADSVGTLIKKLQKEQGTMAVAAFIALVEREIAKNASREAVIMSGMLASPEMMANAIGKLMGDLDPDELAELLGGDE